LYEGFTKQTGIKINRIEGKEEELLERIKNEGSNSPADVLLTVDAAPLPQAHELGLFAPVKSPTSRGAHSGQPAHRRLVCLLDACARHRLCQRTSSSPTMCRPTGTWPIRSLKGQVCTRSGSHPYNLSLMASIIANQGEAQAEAWAKGVVANFARAPKGGRYRSDQGRCCRRVRRDDLQYLLPRPPDALGASPKTKHVVAKIGVVWPDQAG
jgi:iron(III) transport system substrate-binding protein